MPTPTIDREVLAAQYGWALGVFRAFPELNSLFNQAVQNTWSQGMFVAKLRNTKWFRSRSEASRTADILKQADPGEFVRRKRAAYSQVQDMYQAMTGKMLPAKVAASIAGQAFQYGFTESELKDVLGRQFNAVKAMQGGLGGTLGEAERQIRNSIEDYGLDLGEPWIARQLNAIALGGSDPMAVANYLRQVAIRKYGAGFKDELEQGMTIRDIAEPFRQLMAKTLEVSDKSISVTDPSIQQALLHREPAKGGKPGIPAQGGMPLWQFEQKLKADPRWMKTQNAQDQVMSAGRKVLEDWGLLGSAN